MLGIYHGWCVLVNVILACAKRESRQRSLSTQHGGCPCAIQNIMEWYRRQDSVGKGVCVAFDAMILSVVRSSTFDGIVYTVYNIQYTTYSIHYTLYNIRHTLYSIQYTVYSI